jgi:hypothetical protein
MGASQRNSMQQNEIQNIPLPRGPGPKKKKKTKRQRTWDKLPGWIKNAGFLTEYLHKISTRDGSVIDSDLTYKFWNIDRSSHGVFVSKNQTKANYPFDHRTRTASPPLPPTCQLLRITNPIF